MKNQQFVSLCFYSNKVQILQFDNNHTAVKLYKTIRLAKGVIDHYHVSNQEYLVRILKKAWVDYGITEHLVGIVVPEFSTFTKSIFLPHINLEELNEAVTWQSQDFMPSGIKDVVMDWKIVKKNKDNVHILAVAISKSVLSGYVDVASKANLYPLVVETPSLSLERIADGSTSTKLIIYTNSGEAILAFVKGTEIIGSSVVGSTNQDGILQTAHQMIEHYRDTEISGIYVGGAELTQKLLSDLSTKFSKKVQWINPNIKGISPVDAQDYLIPISLQRKDPVEPKNERTINLLPPTWVKQYEKKRLFKKMWTGFVVVSLVVWINFFIVFGMYMYLVAQLSSIKRQSVTSNLPPKVASELVRINKMSDKTVKITETSKSPKTIIQQIISSAIEGIEIQEYQFNLDIGSVEVSGRAEDRQSLVRFKNELESHDEFSKVSIPLTNYQSEKDIDFSATFTYLPIKTSKKIKLNI